MLTTDESVCCRYKLFIDYEKIRVKNQKTKNNIRHYLSQKDKEAPLLVYNRVFLFFVMSVDNSGVGYKDQNKEVKFL